MEGGQSPAAWGQMAGLGGGLQVSPPLKGRELVRVWATGTGDAVFLFLALSTMGTAPQPELEMQN